MAVHPYTTVPGRIKNLMEKIRTVGVPERANRNWLMLIGFKSSNDRTMLSILKHIGFLNAGGQPTDSWRAYRGPNHGVILADALRDAYKGIFETFEEPWKLSTNELKDYFAVDTGSAEGTVSKMVDTFKSLCSVAEFKRSAASKPPSLIAENAGTNGLQIPLSQQGKSVNININVELPITDDDEVYRRIFKALKDYLID